MKRLLAIAIVVVSLGGGLAVAQQVEIEAPPPERSREPEIIVPGPQMQVTRPTDADHYPPTGPRVPYEPAWVAPLSTKITTRTGTGRMGIAGWTSPSAPVGAPQTGNREVTGWFSFGFAFAWDGPPSSGQAPER